MDNEKPTSYTEWVDGINKRNYQSVIDKAINTILSYRHKRGITHKQDNIIYVEFKNG